MSDKELDEILNEIKNRAAQKSEPANPAENETNEIVEETIKAEEPAEVEEPIEAEEPAPIEEIPFSIPEEATTEEAPKAEEVVFTIPEEPQENEAPAPEEEEPAPEAEEVQEESTPAEGIDLMSFSAERGEEEFEEYDEKKSKKPLIIAIAAILIIALGVGIYFGFFHNKEEEPTTTAIETTTEESTTEAIIGTLNPLTGESGYNEAAIGKRPVAVVVENEFSTESVRPQWGLNEADIVLEGESEYSTRLLLFWSDYTNMPKQIGPTRSARPPFIRFSQLFDCVFIHAGLSKTKGNYIGANTVFKEDNVDHINLLKYSEDGVYFGRDKSRTSTIEHTGYLNGTNTAELLSKAGINTSINTAKFTELEFNEKAQALSDKEATSAKFVWSDVHSSGHCPKVGKFSYDKSAQKYTTADFDSRFDEANLEFENLIFLFDTTEYVVKANYKGSGNSETYCDYKLSGGKGTILSEGTAIDITWGVSNGKLWMKDSEGNAVKLNPGKSYIGYGSSNHGGSVTLNFE